METTIKTKAMYNSKFLYILIVLTVLVSCKTSKNIVKTEVVSESLKALIKNVQLTEPMFRTANVSRLGMDITYNNRKFNVAASCKIIKDSAIYLSIQPVFGIELYKAEITTDSIHIFDKMNRRHYAVDYKFFNRKLGIKVNYFNLQALISNQFFCIGEINTPISGFTYTNQSSDKPEIIFKADKLSQSTFISKSNTIDKVVISGVDSKYILTTIYTDYQISDSINFPKKINISASNLNNKIICDFKINKVSFNTNVTLSKTDKSNYTLTNIDQFLNK